MRSHLGKREREARKRVRKSAKSRRWNYSTGEYWNGMFVAAEEAVSRFFPDMSECGNGRGTLWVQIK